MNDRDIDVADDENQDWRKSFILADRSANLCGDGLPGYSACEMVDASGGIDYVLVCESALNDGTTTYIPSCPQAGHEQCGVLPDDWRHRIESSLLRCGWITAAGRRCKTRVHRPGESCWRHTTDR